jgi:hypothetical protein
MALVMARPVSAIGPGFFLVSGDRMAQPIALCPGIGHGEFLWGGDRRRVRTNGGGVLPFMVAAARERPPLPPGLEGRAYLNVAIFWGRDPHLCRIKHPDAAKADPTDASQHGRLYLPTASAPAVVVATFPAMASNGGGAPEGRSVPTSLDEFIAGWELSAAHVALLREFGVPGL